MLIKILVLGCYFGVVLVLGFMARSRLRDSPSQYFLAGRGLSSFVLIGTMAATNFSAFTVFGASGAGYRDGLAFFPIMGFGTGFMALTFWLIGRRVWQLGRENDLVTPAEMVASVYKHRGLSFLFALVMVVFTVPYLALQPMAGGYVLSQLFGLPQAAGAGLITAVIVLYTLRGGLKAVAWTDVFQGLLMVALMVAALVAVAAHHGGMEQAFSTVRDAHPELFARPGGQGRFGPGIWFSYMLLWFFCDPMFPQLFQRFYSAASERDLGRSMLYYPAICTFVFALPVGLGLLGRLDFPGLTGQEADNIVPMLATLMGGDFLGTLIMAAGLAALMSTMDSQLLTLSSIFSRDLYPLLAHKQPQSALMGRIFVVGLAAAGFILAIRPTATILQIATQAFTGLAVLFPTVFFGLYLKNPRPVAAAASILVGQGLLVAYGFNLLPTWGFLPAVPIIAASIVSYLLIHFLTGPLGGPAVTTRHLLYTTGFLGLFLAAQDFWRWERIGGLWLGWPGWSWYFVGLSILQTFLMVYWVRARAS